MKTFIVDSFSDEAFKGNPAGVCLLEVDTNEWQMQSIAKELNLSETAFVRKVGGGNYTIRYFSPLMEIPLCGHATLASAKVLFDKYDQEEVSFKTGDGVDLPVKKLGKEIVMTFPIYNLLDTAVPDEMLRALGIEEYIDAKYNEETNILMIEIERARLVKALSPDFNALVLSHEDINGVLVTAQSDIDDHDFHSRYFWPWSGSNEDPVTGATHTFLSKYWSEKLDKKVMSSFQSSERTGYMHLEITEDDNLLIKGEAVIVFEGTFLL